MGVGVGGIGLGRGKIWQEDDFAHSPSLPSLPSTRRHSSPSPPSPPPSRAAMKTSYQFSNLLGSVYTAGNVVFTPDGETVLSPVGNRLSIFHLGRNTSTTLPFQTRKPIARVALSPADANLVLVADTDGRALLADIRRRSVIASINFKKALRAAKFSNDGRYIAISHGSQVQVWKVPSTIGRQFNPFELHRVYTGHFDDVLSIEWSRDSK